MNRINRILSAVLVIQIVLAVVVFVPRIFPAGASSAPLFGSLKAEDITRFTVSDKDGHSVELVRQGNGWSVSSAADYPADTAKIDTFLGKLLAVQTNPLVTSTSASHKRLQVADDDFVRRVDVTSPDGATRTLFLGTTGTGGAPHVRLGGQDAVYQARELFSYDAATDVVNWINPVYFSVAQENVTALTLQNANGTFEFEKSADGNWALKGLAAGEVFNLNNFTSLLVRIASVRMTKPLGKEAKPEYELDAPGAVITVASKDEAGSVKTAILRIGAKDETDSSYVVGSTDSVYIVRVAGFSVEDFLTRARQDFLQQPTPLPTPEATLAPTATPVITSTLAITPTLNATPQPTP